MCMPERQQLLEAERAVAVEQRLQRRALEVLEQQVRERAVRRRAEAAHDDGVREPRQQLALAARSRSAAGSSAWSGRSTFATSTASRCSSQTRKTS